MTLALYGKSRRRQGALLTAALLAVIIATIGALSAITSAFAHSATITGVAECTNDGWKVTWTIKGDFPSKYMKVVSFTTDDGKNGTPSPNPVAPTYPNGSKDGQFGFQDSSVTTEPHSPSKTFVEATAQVYWYRLNQGGQEINRYPDSGLKTYKAKVDAPDCDRTIRIVKVTKGGGAPSTWSFSGTITNASPTNWTLSNSASSVDYVVPNNQTHTVTEATPGAGWILDGYRVLDSKKSSSDCGTKDSDYSGSAASVPSGTGDKTVCILNKWIGTGTGQLVLSEGSCVVQDGAAYAKFHFLIPSNANVPESSARTLSGTYNPGSASFGPVSEYSDANSHPDWFFTIPFGSNSSITLLTAQTSDGWTWPTTGAGRDKATVRNDCLPKGTLIVGKVKDPSSGVPAADGSQFSGTATNQGNAVHNWGPITFGDFSTISNIPAGTYTLAETGTPNGWTPYGWTTGLVTQNGPTCPSDKASYTAGSSLADVQVTANQTKVVCVMNTKTAQQPSITKVKADEGYTGGFVYWDIKVVNPENFAQTVRIDDANVVFVSATGGTCSDSDFSDGKVTCTVNASSTLTVKVKRQVVTTCREQSVKNAATLYLIPPTGGDPVLIGDAGGGESTEYVIPGNPELCTREIQVCKVLVDNQDGITKTNQSFTIEVNDGSQTQQVTLTVNEGGEQACRTVTVPANAEVKVSETADRPAGWNGDAHGYWNLTLQQGTTYLVTNKENPITVTVKFQKVICESLGDVAANQSTSTNDDIGKPSMSATGGLSSQLNQTAAPAGGDDIVTPSNDGRSKNCHVWGAGAGETGGWNFYIKSTDGSSTLSTVTHQAGNQYATHQLTPAELALAVQASSLRVEEELRTGYGFAGLKCWKDHLNGDNWEWLDFSNGLPGANDEVWCIAYNVPATKQITVQKTFYGASQVSQADYPTFTISDGVDFATACTGPTLSGSGPVTATWTCTVPYLWNGTVTETPAKGWEACERIAALVANNGSQTQEPFTFTNCKQPTIIVKKVVTNVDNDTTQFTVTLTGGQSSQTGQIAEAGGPGPVNATFDNLSTGLGNTYTVVEQPQNGYQVLGYTVNPEGGVCPADPAYTGGGEAAKDAVTVGNLQPGETRVICFYNERFGSVVVDKQAPSGDVAPGTTFNWTISVSVTDGPTSSNLTLTDTLPSGFTYGSPSAASPLSCTLTGLSLSCTLPANTPIGTYTVTIPATVPTNTFAICGRHTNTVSFSGAGIEGRDDATVTIGCTASDGRILVKKVVRGQPGDTTQFTAELTGPGITGTATQPFSQQNVGFFLGLAAGTFSVSEQPKAGYDYAGWAIGTIVGESVQCPANPTGAGSASVTLTNLAPQAAVCFYNDARVTIRVHKTLNVIGFTSNGQGWQFTLTGCGITPQTKTTDANGIADFTDLPPAISCVYTVTETVQPGWTPQFVSQTAQPVAGGQVVRLEFLNIKDFNPPCTDPNDPRCVPPPPTVTPTPPTATPTTTPTATPTNTPTPTPTDTPVTQVAGERTPGPGQSPTPLAPATGFGFGQGEGGMSLLLVLAGLVSLSLGLGFLALGRRTNR